MLTDIEIAQGAQLEPISKITGSRRYIFAVSTSAQQILYSGCYSHAGRHDYETSFVREYTDYIPHQ